MGLSSIKLLPPKTCVATRVAVTADAQALAVALDVARAAKDFAKADALRAELQALGYLVETTKGGTTLR